MASFATLLGNWKPDRKVLVGGLAGVIAYTIQYGLGAEWNIEIPAQYQPLVPLVVAKVVSYITWPAARDIISRVNDTIAAAAGYMPDPSAAARVTRSMPIAPTKP